MKQYLAAVSTRRKLLLLGNGILFFLALYVFISGAGELFVTRPTLLLGVVLLGTLFVGAMVRIAFIVTYRSRQNLALGEHDNFVLGIDSLINLLVVVIVLGSIFPIYKIPFVTFLTSLSVFSVAIAWLFKEYLTNFFDSFRLMFSTDFRIGDYIKVNNDSKGIITDITFRATKVKTDEGDVLFIPNTTLLSSEVTNYSKVKLKRIIVPFALPVNQTSSLQALEEHLGQAISNGFPDLIELDKVFLRIKGMEEGEISCALEISVREYNFMIEDNIKRAVYEAVLAVKKD